MMEYNQVYRIRAFRQIGSFRNIVVHLPWSIDAVKLMVQFVLARHVTEGAKVTVAAYDALPTHASE